MKPIIESSSGVSLAGPSGRAMAHQMDSSLLEALQNHLTMERNASAFYFAASIWFCEQDLRGFTKFFQQESISEQQHAGKFAEYLVIRAQPTSLQAIPAPPQSWDSVEEVILASFQLETDVTTSLNQIYSMAERFSDTRTTVFLDPIIENQLTSEDEFSYLLGRVRFARNSSSALLIIDGELATQELPPIQLA